MRYFGRIEKMPNERLLEVGLYNKVVDEAILKGRPRQVRKHVRSF